MKILAWDIESSPHNVVTWGLFNQNISLAGLLEPSEVLCFAAQWVGSNRMEFHSIQRDGKDAMLDRAWNLLNEADALLSWNGKSFDTKTLNKEFLLAGMPPPAPVKEIDLMVAAKKRFRLASNKLDFVAQAVLGESKVHHEGMPLWLKCMEGDESAWRKMRKYNRQDVALLIRLYEKLLPWIPGHPNVALYGDDEETKCPKCGSQEVTRQGYAITTLGKFQRYRCSACKAWSRSGQRIAAVDLREEVA